MFYINKLAVILYLKLANVSQNNMTSMVRSYKSLWLRFTFLCNAFLYKCVDRQVAFVYDSALSFYATVDFIPEKLH